MRNEDKEFDLLVRSMLENAQEEVPSRVWENCEAALDAKRRPVVLWWRRAAIGLGAAAAAVALVLLAVRQPSADNVGKDLVAVQEKVTSSAEPSVEKDTAPAASQSLLAVSEPAAHKSPAAAAKPSVKAPEASPAEVIPQEENNTADIQIYTKDEEESSQASPEGLSPEERIPSSVTDLPSSDPFAAMEVQESRKPSGKRFSLALGGQMLTNGNPQAVAAFNGRRAMAAAPPTETNIHQTSTNSIYAVPISVGLTARYNFTNRWSVSAGFTWSMMERTFTGVYTEVKDGVITNSINSDIHNTLHYVGIPLMFGFNIIDNGRFMLYAFAGGSAEKGIVSRFRISPSSGAPVIFNQSIPGVQLSVGGGLGAQFNITKFLGIYIDPSLRYWFDCNQPVIIRTQQPLMVGFEAGVRFNL